MLTCQLTRRCLLRPEASRCVVLPLVVISQRGFGISRKRCAPATALRTAQAHGHAGTATPEEPRASQQQVLYISSIWPERSSSAAGVRTSDILTAFQSWGWSVAYVSSARPNAHSELLAAQGCRTFSCLPNREADFAAVLQQVHPSICVFDRFYAEEAFSFRVRELAPQALRVVDMQDMHFLREGRQAAAKAGSSIAEIMAVCPDATSANALRELASIYRSDLTLVCSPAEMSLLLLHYQIPACKLLPAPFFMPPPPRPAQLPAFHDRKHFVTLGNFRHPPNMDSVRWLHDQVWPLMRKRLDDPAVELHVYGAAITGAAQQLNRPKQGFLVKGRAASLDVLRDYRVCLAPLRFGAGLKGKIADSWAHGLPVVTTSVGSEGMQVEGKPWGGVAEANDAERFAEQAAELYLDAEAWRQAQAAGLDLLGELYDQDSNLAALKAGFKQALSRMERHRQVDLIGAILWTQQMRSTEYFSRWIEMKETAQNGQVPV
ncbi:hypothetical protein WJX72_010518 [[Myrmecia] bisecta]|uniref:Glycosyltransferase n=1 Tax=[Myrmecia] bisecta TaxID=41462 RepID=A0AAW1PPQ9_9CHLO